MGFDVLSVEIYVETGTDYSMLLLRCRCGLVNNPM